MVEILGEEGAGEDGVMEDVGEGEVETILVVKDELLDG